MEVEKIMRVAERMQFKRILQLLEQDIVKVGSATKWAAKHNISPQYLSDIRKGRRGLTHRVLTPLGIMKKTIYERLS